MDLNKFKSEYSPEEEITAEVAPPDNIPVVDTLIEPIPDTESLEKISDFSESDKIIADLEAKISSINQEEFVTEVVEEEKTILERIIPYVLPVVLTILALLLTILLLYFFSKNRVDNTPKAITNVGQLEEYVPVPKIVVVEESQPLVCTEPQILNELGDLCIDPPAESEPAPAPLTFENGTTTVVNVRFSYDRQNYDNTPRGIFLNELQIFEGDYKDYKISASNRAFANDYFFGVDRYMVSLIGECSYVVDDADILVANMQEGNNFFTGRVLKVIKSSKPRIDCN